jgi:hypothetical protein
MSARSNSSPAGSPHAPDHNHLGASGRRLPKHPTPRGPHPPNPTARVCEPYGQLIPPQRSIAEPATIRCAKPGNGARIPAFRNKAAAPEGVASPQSPLPLRRPPRRLRASATVSLKARPQWGCSPHNPSGWLPMRAPTSSHRRPARFNGPNGLSGESLRTLYEKSPGRPSAIPTLTGASAMWSPDHR